MARPAANPAADPEPWLIVVRPLTRPTPAAVRVRTWLKAGLRAFGLRCVLVREPIPAELEAARAHPGPA